MRQSDLQRLCEQGQQQLMHQEYLAAETLLAAAEAQAYAGGDFDTLARLYLPLQEARRQRRQCCGEGIVCLDLVAEGPDDQIEGRHVIENYPHGQLLVAGWQSIEPAVQVRALQKQHELYLETFLAAVYPVGHEQVVVIVPTEDGVLPSMHAKSLEQLRSKLPPHCLILPRRDLPTGIRRGTAQTYGEVLSLWERLHTPFLAAADRLSDPLPKIDAYRKTIAVDYACELAHQHLSDVARNLARHPHAAGQLVT